MKIRFAGLILILSLAFILAACGVAPNASSAEPEAILVEGGSIDEEQVEQNMEDDSNMEMNDSQGMVEDEMKDDMTSPTDAMTENEDSMDAVHPETEEGADMIEGSMMVNKPAFFGAQLINATTRESFTLNDYENKIVLVETLAMWCSNCLKQQTEVKALHQLIGENDDFVSVGLDIDPNENLDDLNGYVLNNGFDWLYAVAPVEVAREIGQLYGSQFLNPPSTPMFIIDRNGEVHPLPFGIKSADQLYQELLPFLNGEM